MKKKTVTIYNWNNLKTQIVTINQKKKINKSQLLQTFKLY